MQTVFHSIWSFIVHVLLVTFGLLWAYFEPSVPFLALCLVGKVLDVVTAVRMNRRIHRAYAAQLRAHPKIDENLVDGKIHSQHMGVVIGDLGVVFGAVVFAHVAGVVCPHAFVNLDPAEAVAAIYSVIQFWSVLENESCCSEATWARAIQHIVADKAYRRFGVKIKELKAMRDAAGHSVTDESELPPCVLDGKDAD